VGSNTSQLCGVRACTATISTEALPASQELHNATLDIGGGRAEERLAAADPLSLEGPRGTLLRRAVQFASGNGSALRPSARHDSVCKVVPSRQTFQALMAIATSAWRPESVEY
jgi:hypothetical protein